MFVLYNSLLTIYETCKRLIKKFRIVIKKEKTNFHIRFARLLIGNLRFSKFVKMAVFKKFRKSTEEEIFNIVYNKILYTRKITKKNCRVAITEANILFILNFVLPLG